MGGFTISKLFDPTGRNPELSTEGFESISRAKTVGFTFSVMGRISWYFIFFDPDQ